MDFGRLDIVVNNAGVSFVGPHIVDTTDEAWHTSIDVMQTGVFYGMRAAARHMLPQQLGQVIATSSIRGFSSNPGRIAYSAAKAAVLMMTRVAAGEWAEFGVRANAIAPGPIRTPMWESDAASGAVDDAAYVRTIPAGRLGTPSEVGQLVVFLASDRASYINGSCVTIDGGADDDSFEDDGSARAFEHRDRPIESVARGGSTWESSATSTTSASPSRTLSGRLSSTPRS